MTAEHAAARLAQLTAAIREREEAKRKVEALTRMINELSGITEETRKPAKKTRSAEQFRKCCNT